MTDEIDLCAEMQELANVVVPQAPDKWETLNVIFEFYEEGGYGIDAWADVAKKRTPIDFEEDEIDKLEILFQSIQTKTRNSWKKAQFVLSNEGECEMSFDY